MDVLESALAMQAAEPFAEAVKQFAKKTPTAWGDFTDDINNRAFVSAYVESAKILDEFRQSAANCVAGQTSIADERLRIKNFLTDFGYEPEPGKEGTIQDLRTRQRLDIMLDTNQRKAYGYAQKMIANDPDVIAAYPAWELIRGEDRVVPRGTIAGSEGWGERWKQAANDSGDEDAAKVFEETGRMVALKNSPIWESLGEVADDSLSGGTWPFAFNSGMVTEDVDMADAMELGLLETPDEAEPAEMDGFNDGVEFETSIGNADILSALISAVADFASIKNGVLKFL